MENYSFAQTCEKYDNVMYRHPTLYQHYRHPPPYRHPPISINRYIRITTFSSDVFDLRNKPTEDITSEFSDLVEDISANVQVPTDVQVPTEATTTYYCRNCYAKMKNTRRKNTYV